MLARLKKRSGNRYTMISIIVIILMLYLLRFAFRGTGGEYPQTVYFSDSIYAYSQTVKLSPLKFERNFGKSYQGYAILTLRDERAGEVVEKVYIYEGWKNYREYVIEK